MYALGMTDALALVASGVAIVLAAVCYGVLGGVLSALSIGLIMLAPPASDWLIRLNSLVFFGLAAGLLVVFLRNPVLLPLPIVLPSRRVRLRAVNRLTFDLRRSRKKRPLILLLVVGINNFDHIVNWLGIAAARRLPAALCGHLEVLKQGGLHCYDLASDRLLIVLSEIAGGSPLVAVEHIADRLKELVTLDDAAVHVETAIGYYPWFGDIGIDADEAIRRASSALLSSRERNGAVMCYTPDLDSDARENARLLGSLQAGLGDGRVFLVYQPKVDIQSDTVIAAEALVRLSDYDGRVVCPDRFIPLAEQSSVIHPLTGTVITQAVAQLAEWHSSGHTLKMVINFSVHNLQNPQALGELIRVLAQHRIAPQQVEIEVTETAVIRDTDGFVAALRRARELGLQVALDDFGAGYTTLRYLAELPVDVVKIDQSLIRTMATDPRRASIVRAIIRLGRDLGLRVTAEGVETAATYRLLREAGCHEAQGYLLARPMSAAAFSGWVSAWPARAGRLD